MESSITIERCHFGDIDRLARLRAALWPGELEPTHRRELGERLSAGKGEAAVFLARSDADGAIGFAEATLRRDYVNGCDTTPVAFLEGIYVLPTYQRRGIAKSLCAAVEVWGRSLGCSELGSDAALANEDGHALHLALGFEERERVVFFRKQLSGPTP